MKALLCKEFGPPETLSYEDVDDPVISPGKVIVDIYSASVNFPDVLIIEDKYHNDFNDIECRASLLQFTTLVGLVLDIKNLKIDCNYSGTYKINDIDLPKEKQKMNEWIKLLFSIDYNKRHELNSWCFII